ncbi:MAG: fibronectin type III domain-containing protein, partial [Candidatus Omnitrophota bacterium]
MKEQNLNDKLKLKLIGLILILPVTFVSGQVFAANQMVTDSYSFTIVPDTTAPAAVSNLAVVNISQNSATLSWSAPGDDGSTGTAASYDIRYSTAAITAVNWASATQASGEPT